MKFLWHFVRRDFKDNIVGWILLLLITGVHSLICVTKGISPAMTRHAALIVPYFLFSMINAASVWGANSANQQSYLSKHYLLALPLPRNVVFRIGMLRGMVTALPLVAYLVILPFLLSENELAIARFVRIHPWYFTLHLGFLSMFLFFYPLTNIRLALFHESLRRTVGKGPRFLKHMKYAVLDMILVNFSQLAVLFLWFLGASKLRPEWLFAATIASIAFQSTILWNSYRRWMWE